MRSAEKFDGGVKETAFFAGSPRSGSADFGPVGAVPGKLGRVCLDRFGLGGADKRLSFGSGAARSGARRVPGSGDLNGCAPAITPHSLPTEGWFPVAEWRSDGDQPGNGRA